MCSLRNNSLWYRYVDKILSLTTLVQIEKILLELEIVVIRIGIFTTLAQKSYSVLKRIFFIHKHKRSTRDERLTVNFLTL